MRIDGAFYFGCERRGGLGNQKRRLNLIHGQKKNERNEATRINWRLIRVPTQKWKLKVGKIGAINEEKDRKKKRATKGEEVEKVLSE